MIKVKRKPVASLLDKAWSGEAEGYVGFCRAASVRWFNRWLHPEIQHCFVIVRDGNHMVLVSPDISRLSVSIYEWPDNIEEHFDAMLVPFKCSVDVRTYHSKLMIGVHSCVEVVKSVIGVRNPLILTPYQLYKHMAGERS